ncbi:yippee-domain-containing protein [Myriangium duriaei CBS 260.36]|uniref:Yippee-domain-containing protein n=1 Tax=Myriangium duriaei CBS 260.36 TaxID=1168546 RepID=A0A9P4J344_9PEZI|nr:yippee-domain-containing protein [Myriangium duriaei CBS 260.36]
MPNVHLPSPPSLFPSYLTSPLKFRRKSSSSSAGSSALATSTPTLSADFPPACSSSSPPAPTFLSGSTSRLRCARCLSDLALSSQIISKGFTGRHGRAYLVAPSSPLTDPVPSLGGAGAARKGELPNTFIHRPVPRQLVTGLHTVGDISCAQCGSVLGWKYVSADEEAQRYKVGKFILEGKRVVSWGGWEDDGAMEGGLDERVVSEVNGNAKFEEDEIEFDSQDEDECEELFMGVWNPQTALRRRRMKRFGRDA